MSPFDMASMNSEQFDSSYADPHWVGNAETAAPLSAEVAVKKIPKELPVEFDWSAEQRESTIDLNVGLDDSLETLSLRSEFAKYLYHLNVEGGAAKRLPPPPAADRKRTLSSAGTIFEWEGSVDSVDEDDFEARLVPVKGLQGREVELARFSINQVPYGDRDLVVPGAPFRWTVGMVASAGTRMNYSDLVFRRLPAWTEKDIAKGVAEVREIFSSLSSDDEATASQQRA